MQVALVRSAAARRSLSALHVAVCVTLAVSCAGLAIAGQPQPLDPLSIPRFVEPLPMPLRVPVTSTTPAAPLEISLNEFQQQLLPASFYATLPAPYRSGAWLWCYKAAGFPQTFPGPTLEARVGVPASIRYVNNLTGPGGSAPVLQSMITVDQTLHWADPLGQAGSMKAYAGPVPAVTHLHGGEVPSAYDGGPNGWWTPGLALKGTGFVSDTYTYPNRQEATTLWYHDHTLGATRTNVYAGLAGFYLLRDPAKEPADLPGGPLDPPADVYGNPYEREIVIQDRMFDQHGQLFWPAEGVNPDVHPFWGPEFFGDFIMVNGKTWPFLQVEPRRYRFRFLDGSNARFYDMRAVDAATGSPGPTFWQIGSDGGLLETPVALNAPPIKSSLSLKMAPGERADLIVDFSGWAGRTFNLVNAAAAPFPAGDAPDPHTTGLIMQFRVGTTVTGGRDASLNPARVRSLRAPIERPTPGSVTRALTLNELEGPGGPLEMFVNNTMWDMGPTENVKLGDTEVWEIINLTADTHPIHLHLIQYQLLSRQAFDVEGYLAVYGEPEPGKGPPLAYGVPSAATGMKLGGNPDVTPFLIGKSEKPEANERGWKDTFRMNTGEVTRVLVRAAPQAANALAGQRVTAGMNLFPFDPSAALGVANDGFGFPGGPGYVWHCHIVDHEDNEMMRQFMLVQPAPTIASALSSPDAAREPVLAGVALGRAEPTPCTGNARIAFTLPEAGEVELVVFDLAGRAVARLAAGRFGPGEHVVRWAGVDDAGRALPSGTYLYRLLAADQRLVRRLVLIR
ncbi:MAG TPA: multicopper oxidase domain-containing protein [Candidatus Eisenbacteria bacterium]|jgi:FtsP/CotA-like multicopper oxidase with cupredoxin domain